MYQWECRIASVLEKRHIYIAVVPANCTNRRQPDISINKAVKAFLRNQFQDWYAKHMCQQIRLCSDDNTSLTPVDLKMVIVKPLTIKLMLI